MYTDYTNFIVIYESIKKQLISINSDEISFKCN